MSEKSTSDVAEARATADLLETFDKAPLNRRYWAAISVLSCGVIFDNFDFYIVGFLVAVLAPQWHLTFGESAIMLLSAGIGTIVGGLCWGKFADTWGRRTLIVIGMVICAAGSVAISLLPTNSWWLFSICRFVIGFGLAGATSTTNTLQVEYTPTRFRSVLTSLYSINITVGILLASSTASLLLALVGWRGVAALGVAPAFIAVLVLYLVPESVRWLLANGRFKEARETMAKLLNVPLAPLPLPTQSPPKRPLVKLSELYSSPSRFWLIVLIWVGAGTADYGIYLWGPTIVAFLLKINIKEVGQYFAYVAIAGIVGKVVVSFAVQWLGRRRSGQIMGYGGAIFLTAAAVFHLDYYNGFPLFIVFLTMAAFFFSGGYSNIAPYTAEVYPVRMAARASGLGQAANGIGRILGPLTVPLIAGSGSYVTPAATADVVLPVFLFLASCCLIIGLTFTFLGIETHGRPLALDILPETGASPTEAPSAVSVPPSTRNALT